MNTNGNQRSPVKLAAVPQSSTAPDPQPQTVENSFSALLKRLGGGIRKEDVKRREGWRDRGGQTHYVDYVEWHVVADLLDKIVPDWSHAVRGVVQIGDFVAVTAAITINGVTREGIGTGAADSETGIKKAEHDGLKRAAVKFGIARDLYRDEEKGSESSGQTSRPHSQRPSNPIARTMNELISPKQIGLIKKLAAEAQLDPEEICQEMYHAGVAEISRRAASALIQRLQAESTQEPRRSSR